MIGARVRVAIVSLLASTIAVAACRGDGASNGDAGTCPVMPAGGVLHDLSDVPPKWCGSPECPSSDGCCGYGAQQGETCFMICGRCDRVPREEACVTTGSCTTDADCHGTLPHICQSCPLSPDGHGSQGCAHWECNAGKCQVAYCARGLVCQADQRCPSYYMPPVDRSCSTDADCVLVEHRKSCCIWMKTAVRAGEQEHFADVEKQCGSSAGPYDCQCPGGTVSEDGTSPGPGQSIAAACVAGTCKAIIRGSLQCGTTTCAPGESCCATPGDGGACVFSCATSCVPATDDAGALIGCGGRTEP